MDPTPADPRTPLPTPAKVVYEIVYNDAHIVALWRRLRHLQRGRVFMNAFRVFACLLLAGLLGLVLWHQPRAWGLILALAAFFLLVACSHLLDQWLVVLRWRRARHRNARGRMELTAAGVQAFGEHSESTSQWSAFASTRRFPDGFLLIIDRYLAYWLPHEATAAGTVEDAALLISAGVADYQEA